MNIDLTTEALEKLPTLKELRVPSEILEALEDLSSTSETSGVEPERLELLLRFAAFHLLKSWMGGMIKLTRIDGIATFLNPAHIVLVTEARNGNGDTITAVYTTGIHPVNGNGLCEHVKESPRHVARMCGTAGKLVETNEHDGTLEQMLAGVEITPIDDIATAPKEVIEQIAGRKLD